LAVVPHPLADNHPADVRRKAEIIVDEIIAVLTEPADELANRYRGRFLRLAERRLGAGATCTDTVCVEPLPTGGPRE
jgi:hypothetical protein